ncbi:unnamed protein product [Cyprideis torosa]|uniref:UTP23 sensor motif region domain-containing protein n=1 Tax=Cyprideis torosa TaxID=163714 RepID=A0A7R8W839_9CRUS|nr:unnamed protein product [Cyprideis torosa]CAG0883909.1 unnamed protein product [Cyprideis torosa]
MALNQRNGFFPNIQKGFRKLPSKLLSSDPSNVIALLPLIFLFCVVLLQCGHGSRPVTGSKCIESMVTPSKKDAGPRGRYIVATQDKELTLKLRSKGGVPILYLHDSSPVLEAPSEASLARTNDTASEKLSKHEKKVLKGAKKEFGIAGSPLKKKRRKKPKGPNPLSCLPKKKKRIIDPAKEDADEVSDSVKRRKKNKIKIAKHVREHLQSQLRSTT